jgi:hypothetical protein
MCPMATKLVSETIGSYFESLSDRDICETVNTCSWMLW